MADAAPPAPAAKALGCPSCGGTLAVRAAGYTVTIACQYCSSILDVSQPQVKLVTQYHEAAARLEIPLGTRGTLRGVEWEAIGYLARSERGQYGWEEYLLFNPYHGYRWLIANRGGWSFGELLTVVPGHEGGITLDGKRYKPFFADGTAQVDYVVGEFYWRVKRGETVRTDDWVRPGFMLSREADDREVSWSLSELLDPKEMKAFGVTANPSPSPPLPHQPSPHVGWLKQGLVVALLAIAVLLGVAIFSGGGGTVFTGTAPIAADGSEQEATLGPFTLARARQGVKIETRVPALSNGWVDINYALVSRADQKAYTASKAAEAYSGRDTDGSWSEGSRSTGASFAAVPAGTYDLIVSYRGNVWVDPTAPLNGGSNPGDFFGGGGAAAPQPAAPDWRRDGGEPPQLQIEVRTTRFQGGVLVLALFLIAIPLLIGLIRHAAFESARSGESDFAPVLSDEED
ncbi:DUF4178 domain-containing protein [Sphingomonas qomolangmaensis]|uniref:DUF4178 domain-containing protein n=1 Tax=Sphingomonas qomolangmaensis TaxID=2918765 RepID=A0ABY5L8D6_9SPHN|nr:DUF4178 domain-containing protein [Sphingomonas qomolangmaensis]UUL81858.1 DUF4178 domain-containing protein [Sphingomonas qomolangmaensis]